MQDEFKPSEIPEWGSPAWRENAAELKKLMILSYFCDNRKLIKDSIEQYKTHPVEMRNLFAENGQELTPEDLRNFCDELELLIEHLDE